ncbi:MAG: transposase [Verrucomicrobiota bacterium]
MTDRPLSFLQRKNLPHTVPHWVSGRPTYFITICCKDRSNDELLRAGRAEKLVESVKFYQGRQKWWSHLFVVMPDHVHGLFVFSEEVPFTKTIAAWKSFHTHNSRIAWQDGFFEHRIRGAAEFGEKSAYIRHNPVRAKLVTVVEEWPHFYEGLD